MEWIIDKVLQIIGFAYKKTKKEYIWIPTLPLRNTQTCTPIDKHPKDFEMKDGDITFNMVSGVDAFTQQVRNFLLTKRRTYPIYSENYGIEEADTIFTEKDVIEFQRQCSNIALHLLEYFSKWIEEIYQIQRKKNVLIVEMKVAGRAETLRIEVKELNQK